VTQWLAGGAPFKSRKTSWVAYPLRVLQRVGRSSLPTFRRPPSCPRIHFQKPRAPCSSNTICSAANLQDAARRLSDGIGVLCVPLTNNLASATVCHVHRKSCLYPFTPAALTLSSPVLPCLIASLFCPASKTRSFIFNTLHTILNSQFHPNPFFCCACALFAKNTGGGGLQLLPKPRFLSNLNRIRLFQ